MQTRGSTEALLAGKCQRWFGVLSPPAGVPCHLLNPTRFELIAVMDGYRGGCTSNSYEYGFAS